MGVVHKGFRRRARLLREALRPPRQLITSETAGSGIAEGLKARRPPKRTQIVDYAFPTVPRLVRSPSS
ncbi:hypothetical protein HD597_004950 [Nonomuraea thailandensis]|uniref:Uncharacterized protein n=1 Tax=Nonomuraea thailandensis TaxID=1188745 RepID=A0A9X2GHI0_9ACTN|nr:hypothetical protein [Nonomuraea thailandensis]